MVEAAQAQAHHQHDRQAQALRQVRHVVALVQGHPPAACTFDHHHVCRSSKPPIRLGDDIQFDPHTGPRCGDMRRNRFGKGIGIDIAQVGIDVGRVQQRRHIPVQFARRAARRHRLHRRHAQAARAQGMNQR